MTSVLNRKSPLRRFAVSALAALGAALLCVPGFLANLNSSLSDALYQRPSSLDGEIVLINIDERALDTLGPTATWGRDVYAQALETLNADPESRPAVIGVDVLFTGTSDPVADARLAAAAGAYGNVVVATSATIGPDLVTLEDGSFYMDSQAVLDYAEPYSDLNSVTTQGHINAMLDTDGILRRALWQLDLPDGRRVPSFHQQLYRRYAAQNGLNPDVVPPADPFSHFWYLSFQASPGDFNEGLSLADLLAGELDSAMWADKIVLIGPYAAGLQDSYPTAIDHATAMYGVEYQANAVTALIRGDFRTEVPMGVQAVIVFSLALLALLWLWERRVVASVITWIAGCAVWLALCLGLWNGGYVLQVLYVPLVLTVLLVISVAANYVRATQERRRVTATFQRYVAPEIVAELLHGDPSNLELGGKLTDIAVLFVDIRGFTTMSEGLDPPTVVEIINRYLTLTSACIFRNGGTLDKYVGDCTMAFWGAPLPQDDCVFKAVKAGLEMVEGAKALGVELQEQFGRTVAFGVGVHFGPAVVGNIGAPARMDYTAIGDTVNTASRLESNAPGGTILVSRAVADALAGRVRFTPLGDSIRLKGKAAGFEILSVDGLCEPIPAEKEPISP